MTNREIDRKGKHVATFGTGLHFGPKEFTGPPEMEIRFPVCLGFGETHTFVFELMDRIPTENQTRYYYQLRSIRPGV